MTESGLAKVKIPSPLTGYIGGKALLADKLIPMFPKYNCYCEAFCGSAVILFRKEKTSCEVINDKNKDVVNVFRVLRDNKGAFDNYLKYFCISRDEFDLQKKTDAESLDAVARAWRFIYLLRLGMGGKIKNYSYGYAVNEKYNRAYQKIKWFERFIDDFVERLQSVNIECLDVFDCIQRYDSENTFFYLDPPYTNSNDYYGNDYIFNDYEKLADVLKNIKSKFLLSIDNCDKSKTIFGAFRSCIVKTRYSCNRNKTIDQDELVFYNYEIPQYSKQLSLMG